MGQSAEGGDGWRVGDVVAGTYEVTEVLGRGGMGVVHRVRHPGWDVDLAVKSPLPELASSPVDLESFVQEAETWVALGLHPHVCTCHYVRTLDGLPRVFAECAGAGSLRQWITGGRLYEGSAADVTARVLDVAIQSARGLAHAHAQGFVHQDVKPANILLDDDGTAKVADFGLARSQQRATRGAGAAAEGATLQVTVGGMTPAYASPEQAAGATVGRRSDVWSLAVSVLEMLAGEVVWYAGPVAADSLETLGSQERPVRVPLSQALVELLARCLDPEPANRPDAARVAAELAELYGRELRRPYPRPEPQPLLTRADELNNRALSLLDLGRAEEAAALFEEARAADPHHPELLYNSGLVRWRAGELTDDALVRDLETSRARSTDPERVADLLARVDAERGDRRDADVTVLAGHARDVEDVCTTPDGRLAVSASLDRTVRVWDVATGREVRTLTGHPSHVTAVCATPDGRHVLSAGNDAEVRVWETDTGRPVRTITGNARRPNPYDQWTSLCPTPDGRRVLTGGWDRPVQLWDVATGKLVREFPGHTTFVTSVSVTPDGRHAVSGSGPQEALARVWDLATGRCLRTLDGRGGGVHAVCTTPDGRQALTAHFDGRVRLWDLATGTLLRELRGHTDAVLCVCAAPDGRYALSGGHDGSVRVWELATGRCVRTFTGHTHWVNSVCTTPDGRHALSAARDGTVRIWRDFRPPGRASALQLCRPSSHGELAGLAARVESLVGEADRATDERRYPAALALLEEARQTRGHAQDAGVLAAWRRLTPYCSRTGLDGVRLAATLTGGSMSEIDVSRDGRIAVTAGDDRVVRVWDLAAGECLHTLAGHDHSVVSVALTPDGRTALSGSWDEAVGVWDVGTGRLLHVLGGHSEYVHRVRVTPDGRYALSAAQDGATRVWEIATGSLLRTLSDDTDSGYAMDVSPDGRLVVSTDDSGTAVRVWDLTTGKRLRTLKGHTEHVDSACVTLDGRYALTSSWDRTARLWELRTGQCLRTLTGHIAHVGSVAATPDGRFALTGSGDGTARVWDLATGEELHALTGHRGTVTSVCFTPDARRALTAGYDGTLRVWELDWRLQAHEPAGWDEGARPYLEVFLTHHALTAGDIEPFGLQGRLLRRARPPRPTWSDEDVEQLHRRLQHAGYGRLDRSAVRTRLEEMAHGWKPRPGR